ncbi:hypothetical protein ONE63_009128 [Megalurothrips usitatus]|uniref:DUF4789 domain-containing protein n=1 Tax=Megalurothrips usitatus TaxID=439358 RepID=A0AAV7XMQ9_9NEOP|nr:hypothetical protein ONE63_009128 [Megalurothrips usitatus]
MLVTLLPPLLLLLGPWGRRGPLLALGSVVPPSWADPRHNPCAAQPGGWQLILWPGDGRCYRIFRRGHPCAASMELTPGVGPGGAPGCRCPPGTALLANPAAPAAPAAQTCHPLLEQGPCPPGQYLAPVAAAAASDDRVPQLRAACRPPDPCPPDHVFWARDGRCYPRLTRGPCYRGELLVAAPAPRGAPPSPSSPPLGACRCEPRGELARFYSPQAKTCHEHYTPGPCQEKGLLFLPGGPGGGQCGCSPDLPHYHPDTGRCYQIDTIGPCPTGHRFTATSKGRAQCRCKGGHVPWAGGGEEHRAPGHGAPGPAPPMPCYRPWTRGPCPAGQLLADTSQCVAAPCRPGRLYFPATESCYKVGVRGPCPKGQVVLFETAVRPALEGISYRGVCGCTGPRPSSNDIAAKVIEDSRCGAHDKDKDAAGVKRSSSAASAATRTDPGCESKAGAVVFNGTCHMLYSQGPCPLGQWLVPQRRSRDPRAAKEAEAGADTRPEHELWSDADAAPARARARCDCRPGYKAVRTGAVLECQPPTVVLASFLNARGFLTAA